MAEHTPAELLDFPCQYQFKAFGDAGDAAFQANVQRAVSRVVPVGSNALRARYSSGGQYQCITVAVRLENGKQLSEIYAMLRGIEGLRYLL